MSTTPNPDDDKVVDIVDLASLLGGPSYGFMVQLCRLLKDADDEQWAKLGKAYPVEAAAVSTWRAVAPMSVKFWREMIANMRAAREAATAQLRMAPPGSTGTILIDLRGPDTIKMSIHQVAAEFAAWTVRELERAFRCYNPLCTRDQSLPAPTNTVAALMIELVDDTHSYAEWCSWTCQRAWIDGGGTALGVPADRSVPAAQPRSDTPVGEDKGDGS